MSAIITRDTQSYASQFVFAVEIMLGCAVLCTLSAYCGEVLRLRWRRRIVHAIQNKYFPTCYGMNNLPPDQMDNTDQRITEAVQDFTSTFGSLFICSFPAGVGGGVQNTFLYVVTSVAVLVYLGDYSRSMLMISMVFAVFNSFLTVALFKPIVALTYTQNEAEGAFRFAHARIRDYCESITIFQGQATECSRLGRTFDVVFQNKRALLLADFRLNLWKIFSSEGVPSLLAYTAVFVSLAQHQDNYCAPQQDCIAYVTNTIGSTAGLLKLFQQIPVLFAQFGTMAGQCHRVGQLLDQIHKYKINRLALDEASYVEVGGKDSSIEMLNVNCTLPDGRMLCRNISMTLCAGDSMVIMGPSGCGKSSLLRILAGLWPLEAPGRLKRPAVGRGGLFFVPQRSYLMFGGSLRQQVLYPDSVSQQRKHGVTDRNLEDILRLVNLGCLVEGSVPSEGSGGGILSDAQLREVLDRDARWEDILSGGEQQLLGFARLFYHQPRFAIMDEATSALDVALEASCMRQCAALGITCVSVAHRPTVVPFHRWIMRMDGKGSFTRSLVSVT